MIMKEFTNALDVEMNQQRNNKSTQVNNLWKATQKIVKRYQET